MPLFEVAMLQTLDRVVANDKGSTVEKEERLVFGPKAVVALNEQAAVAAATARATMPEDTSKLVVLVRPFK